LILLATKAIPRTLVNTIVPTDSLGFTCSPYGLYVTAGLPIQPQEGGSDVGTDIITHMNFVGADVANSNGVTTVTISDATAYVDSIIASLVAQLPFLTGYSNNEDGTVTFTVDFTPIIDTRFLQWNP
jgi:hypothetical protein